MCKNEGYNLNFFPQKMLSNFFWCKNMQQPNISFELFSFMMHNHHTKNKSIRDTKIYFKACDY